MNNLYFGILVGIFVVLIVYIVFACKQCDNYRPKNYDGNAVILSPEPSRVDILELDYPYNYSYRGDDPNYERHQYKSHRRRYNFKNHQNNYR